MENCVFCKIAKKEISSKIIAENDGAIAFLDINPASDGHAIVIPKKHVRSFSECDEESLFQVMKLVRQVANDINDSTLKPWGFNYLSNEGSIAGQEVMHFHIHVIPKYGKSEGFKFSIGNRYVNSIDNVYEKIMKVSKKR